MKNLEVKITATIIQDGKILLIKERNISDNKYYWNLVKGTFEPGKDKSLLDAVARECKEEVNIEVKIKKLINIIYYRKKDKVRFQFNFLCNGWFKKSSLSNQADQKYRNEDIVEIKPFTKVQLSKMKKSQFMNERTYIVLNDFLKGKAGYLSTLKEIIEL